MRQTIWKLENSVKNYDWGSIDNIPKMFAIDNPTKKLIAEIWMGDHPKGCSLAIDKMHKKIRLDNLIKNHPLATLGAKTFQKYSDLPYLFKVLSANKALSIQVHPTKFNAEQGFAKENQLGIALNDPKRNYKDPNHKPELIYALTPFKAMCSFRAITEILALFSQVNVPTLSNELEQLHIHANEQQLKCFFQALLTLSPERKHQAINQLLNCIKPFTNEPYLTIKTLANDYPNDIGIFMPLILNVIQLQPSQAMFLSAQTPHAYLCGTGLEVMASSDNVLRAGLTNKHLDIDELLKNTSFNSLSLDALIIAPIIRQNKIDFPVPVDDFKFEIIDSDNQARNEKVTSAQILFCLEGNITLTSKFEIITLTKGESAFIAYNTKNYCYQGEGSLAKVSN
ncbi:mannose-6-phosphate isomerase, class I [Gilliamella sp. B2776]|uniref:mannose-6-phosphate isomerase, class I n=1 Tax=unclassified Gilliamella TaxID=2685620 RepID=UPI0022698A89|nr:MULTISPECIES: mannose-6-phosphate isomerase, class I [unclassified Gilliamella]MCX8650110.1 mannose-6-phosphate isomerase, class I [Gilliamella sp. B2779]MCX8655043.1 mannose-6-phosphate isomerase, class I [Gilliamella sp. B2737]MCX8656641.1 mannose-6-phosphate isomerase, class I [Gilliamella sp. B2894]MCX8665432.1 mannose-6-phosphate isomerase, class I [Gilliamella sp. B2887]MCX8691883.1 mannose-6-phosphate isomerase, class I [Gilliamella sp. B2776]